MSDAAGLSALRLRTPRLELRFRTAACGSSGGAFSSPVAVEIEGLDGLRSFLGIDRLA
jgi:hypothetical protein